MIDTITERRCLRCSHLEQDHNTGFRSFYPLDARLTDCKLCDCKWFLYGNDNDKIGVSPYGINS